MSLDDRNNLTMILTSSSVRQRGALPNFMATLRVISTNCFAIVFQSA